jgi:hypothetical protein
MRRGAKGLAQNRPDFPMSKRALVLALTTLCASGVAAQNGRISGGNGTIYVGTYARNVLVVDENTFAIRDTIQSHVGVPIGLQFSADRSRLYVTDAGFEKVEVFDLATRKSVDQFTLTEGPKRVRIFGFNVDPRQRFAVMLIKTYTKKPDRFEIGPPKLVRYDLAKHQVTDTIPWPRNEERDNARILFSPSGDYLYFFTTDEILIYETANLKQVDRWELAQPIQEGMGRLNFGFPTDIYEEPGFYTGLFRMTDPVQNRTLMGVARVNLERRDVDFYTLGPSGPVGFALAPDRRRAYGLRQEVGLYEFWTFDLENRRVAARTQFRGRPRMGLTVSSNGRYIYIHTAGSTIDLYDSQTFQHVRTVDLGADMTALRLLPPRR